MLATLVATGACSLLVESTTDQCKTSGDCSSFGAFSVCNAGICVKPTAVADGGSDGSDGSDEGTCFTGAPTTDLQFFNQCTEQDCDPFDNCARLGLCADAALPPLIHSPDGGV